MSSDFSYQLLRKHDTFFGERFNDSRNGPAVGQELLKPVAIGLDETPPRVDLMSCRLSRQLSHAAVARSRSNCEACAPFFFGLLTIAASTFGRVIIKECVSARRCFDRQLG